MAAPVASAVIPEVDADLYSDDALRDSSELFARIRAAGPVVHLPRNDLYAVGRFADVRELLRDDAAFVSGKGVAANPIANRLGSHTTLNSDGEPHARRRRVLMHSLGAKALGDVAETVDAEAARLVDELCARPGFDAVGDFASRLPVAVVAGLVGIRIDAARMLRWAAGTFDALGPVNRRAVRSMTAAMGLQIYSRRLSRRSVRPGSWADAVFDAQERGEISATEARALIVDFVAPALDTTILGSAQLLHLLANNPEVWEQIRADPDLVPAAVVEAVRLASPIRCFTRFAPGGATVGGVAIPPGSRVAVLYASANHDERQFPEPHVFDVTRPNGNHMGWGNGPHTCVGIHLAKLEMQALLRAMIPRVEGVTSGAPTPLLNNTLQGIAAMPAAFVPAPAP